MHRVSEIRRARISGTLDNHERRVGADWVVTLGGERFALTVEADREGATVRVVDGTRHRVASDWTPGRTLARLDVDGRPMTVRVDEIVQGFRMRLARRRPRGARAHAAPGGAGRPDA